MTKRIPVVGAAIIENGKLLAAKRTEGRSLGALMSRLWTGFFGTARCRYPEKFSKPGFQPKMA
ncbi:hypothetical protein ACHWP0_11190 [Weissella cibaria]|uniref:hypothetical protein n=1 Tax=Weissella cibaria TaxID=137591 RepID=UPI00376F1792